MTTSNAMSFTAFLRDYNHTSDDISDFADDWLADHNRPRGRYGWKAVHAHLRAAGATDEAIVAARLAWDQWQCNNSPADSLPMLLERSGLIHPACLYTTTKDLFGVETKTPTPAVNDVIHKLKRSIASFFIGENGTSGTGLTR